MQEVGALGELRSQWMVAPVDSEVQRESLREKVVAFSNVVEHVVSVNGRLYVAPGNLCVCVCVCERVCVTAATHS